MNFFSTSWNPRESNLLSIDLSTRSTTNLTFDEKGSSCAEPKEIQGFQRIGCFGGGIIDDFKRRSVHYASDFADALSMKTLSATAFMFFATVFSTIALGTHLQASGGGYIGVQEYLLMNGVSGILFALLSPQPLMILRPTGPITLILENLLSLSESFNLNFWHLLACSGYFVGLYLTVLASLEVSRLTKQLTRFTYEIFGCYVCSVYVYSGVTGVMSAYTVESYSGDDGDDAESDNPAVSSSFVLASALFVSVVAAATLALSLLLSSCAATPDTTHKSWTDRGDGDPPLASESASASSAENSRLPDEGEDVSCRWTICSPPLRAFLADYAVTVAVVLATLLSYVPAWYGMTSGGALHVDRVSIPHTSFPPTPTFLAGAEGEREGGGGRHTWLVDFSSGEVGEGLARTVCIAALVSLPIAFFFFIDQSLSALLSQQPHMAGMKKGVYLHAPLFLVALCNVIGPSFGLPFVTASLPHSPQLVEALTSSSQELRPPRDSSAGATAVCSENRVAPVLIYGLILSVAVLPPLTPFVRCIPTGAIRGVLIYVGMAGIAHTELYRRCVSLLKPSEAVERQWGQGKISAGRVHLYTILQLAVLAVFWVLNLSPSPAGLTVAFLVAALGPLRLWILPKWFSLAELSVLDAVYST